MGQSISRSNVVAGNQSLLPLFMSNLRYTKFWVIGVFVVLALVSSVPYQVTGLEECISNDLFLHQVGHKT